MKSTQESKGQIQDDFLRVDLIKLPYLLYVFYVSWLFEPVIEKTSDQGQQCLPLT